MMPTIGLHAQRVFHYLDDEARAEAIQETVVRAMLAYYRLHERGRVDLAYPRVLARFAVAQFRDGRRVGERMNRREVLSPYARRMSGIRVESLHDSELPGGPWREALVEDKHAGPAETAAARIDVAEWFASMKRRNRKIAEALSQGFTTKDVARRFRVSPGKISQMRREFCESWHAFQGEQETKAEAEHGDSNWATCNQAARMDNRWGDTTVIDRA
jgi:hypothetical protein